MHKIHKSFIKTKKGKILTIIREHYLRDDIPCLSQFCSVCEIPKKINYLTTTPYNNKYLILDEETAFRQLDLLEIEDESLSNIIILETVLESIRIRNLSAYNRLSNLIRSPNKHFVLFSNEHNKDTYGIIIKYL